MNKGITKYPDGSSYATIDNSNITNTIKWNINSYEDLWHLHQYVDAFNSINDRRNLKVIIPNLIDAQADRRFGYGQSSGLKLVCNFLNSMDAEFRVFHPHNAEVVEALMDNVQIIDNSGFIRKVLDMLPEGTNGKFTDNGILMSADAGGFKPLMKLCDTIKWKAGIYTAAKSRGYKDGKSILTQIVDREDFYGKDVLIVDDLSIYGGTFKGLSKLLRTKNVGNLYLAVSHMTMQNLGDDPVTNYFDKVFTTDSKFDNYYMKSERGEAYQPSNLVII